MYKQEIAWLQVWDSYIFCQTYTVSNVVFAYESWHRVGVSHIQHMTGNVYATGL